jgi:hypothetical protein
MFNEVYVNGEDKSSEVFSFGESLGLDHIVPGRYSTLLLVQLYGHTHMRTLSHFRVTDEIKALETCQFSRGSITKEATPFNGVHLKGLWHKHFQVGGLSAMALNLRLGLKTYGLPAIDNREGLNCASSDDRPLTDDEVPLAVHDAVMGNWMRRASDKKMTGEWLVFARHGGKNYYLCIAGHKTGDENVRAQIDSMCLTEFPFLKGILA